MIYLYNSTETDFRYNGIPLPASFDVVVSHTLNGEYYVIGKHPLDDKLTYKEIVEDRILKVHTMDGMQPFRIVNMNKHETYVEFEAWPLFYADMRNKLVRPLNLKGVSGQAALNAFKNSLLIDTPFDFYSDITDNHDYHTQDENERENNPKQLYNALDVFKTIVKRWGGELWIRGYDIRVNKRIGTDTEAMLYEKKNITEFVDTTNIEGIVTRIHGKSEWQDERQEDEEEGKKHLIETTIDSPLINNYSGVIFEKQYTNNDIRTEQELKNWLNLKFTTENIDKPQRTIEVGTNVIDETKIGFADTLILKYIKHDTDVRIKVVGYEYDGFANELKHVVLGQPKNTSSSTIGNTITDLVNNIVDPVDRKTTIAMNSADGKSTVFHGTADPNTLNLNAKENDTYFRTNGSEKEMWRFTGTLWELIMDTSETTKNADAIAEQQQEIEDAQQTADEAVEQINTAVANAGFTSLDETISSVQSISNQAQINSGTAIDNALEAMQQASQAVDNTGSLNVRVDEVENTLSVKADKQTVDDLIGVVDLQALDIQTNAQGLALKANQDTVDTLAGTVSSLGTEFDIVAGQVNSRVWNTDIETAIDGIEVGGRNYLRNSGGFIDASGWRGGTVVEKDGYKAIERDGGTMNAEGIGLNIEPNSEYMYSGWFMSSEDYDSNNINSTLPLHSQLRYGGGNHRGSLGNRIIYKPNGIIPANTWFRIVVLVRTIKEAPNGSIRFAPIVHGGSFTDSKYWVRDFKLEKGNKATDWTPAPEDTDAKITHVESEFTQKYDSITSTVSSLDGRVAQQKVALDSITSTVGNIEGDIATMELNVSGLQTTVASKASQSQVTQLANGLSSVVSQSIKNFQVYARNYGVGPRGFIKDSDGNTLTGGNIENDRNYMLVIIDENDEVVHKKTYDLYSSTIGESEAISFNNAVNYYDDSHLVIVVGSHAAEQYRRLLIKDTIYNLGGSPEVFENMLTTRASYLLVGRKGLGTRNGYETFAQNKSGYLNVAVPVKNGTTSLIGDFNIVSSQISQLSDNINMRVSKGDLLSQINIEAGRTLIQSDRLLLDANNVVFTGTAWIPSSVIGDLEADKITSGTLDGAKARIINLDFDTAVGNRTNFIRSAWETAAGGSVTIRGGGINSIANDGSQVYIQNGVVGARNPSGAGLGHIGYNADTNRAFLNISTSLGTNFSISAYLGTSGNTTRYTQFEIFPRSSETYLRTDQTRIMGDLYVEGNTQLRNALYMNNKNISNVNRITLTRGGTIETQTSNSNMRFESANNFTFHTRHSQAFWVDGTHTYMLRTLSMEGNRITNQSDERLKMNIENTHLNSLEAIKSWRFVDYDWIEGEHGQFGLIAQYTSETSIYEEGRDVWSIDSSKQLMMTTHAVQQLSLAHDNTNIVASEALILAESNEEKIKRLEKRIEELESAA